MLDDTDVRIERLLRDRTNGLFIAAGYDGADVRSSAAAAESGPRTRTRSCGS